VWEFLPDFDETGGQSKGSDIGGPHMLHPNWHAEHYYRIVYGELWWLGHPGLPRVIEMQPGAADEERPKRDPSSGSQTAGHGDDDFEKDMPYENLGSSARSEIIIRVQLPVPEDFRPMPLKG
jgi:hypothetical protein